MHHKKTLWYKTHKLLISILLMITSILTPVKVSGASDFFGFERKGELNLGLEFMILAFFASLMIFNFLIYLKMGNTSIGKPFAYLMAGITLLVLNRIFFILIEFDVYQITPMTVHGWSHMLFYAGLFLLYLAIGKVGERTRESNLTKINPKDYTIISGFFGFAIFLFLTSETYNADFTKWFMGTVIYERSLLHFSTFIILGIVIFRLLNIRRSNSGDDFGKYISAIIPTFIVFLVLMFMNHTWKYMTDEDIVISVDVETVRLGEQSFWMFGFGVLVYGFLQVYNAVNEVSRGFERENVEIAMLDNPVMLGVLNVLSNHVGSIATNIALQSIEEIGIDPTALKKEDLPNFAQAIQNNTRDLIGDFPSRFLNQAIINTGNAL